jgi:hypothetical protein
MSGRYQGDEHGGERHHEHGPKGQIQTRRCVEQKRRESEWWREIEFNIFPRPRAERPTVVTQMHAHGAAVDNLNRGLMDDYFSDGLLRRQFHS